MRVRVVLGIGLLVLWYLVAAGLVVLFSVATIALLRFSETPGGRGSGTTRLAIGTAVLAVVVAANVVRASARPQQVRGSELISRRQAPDLWRMIDEICGASKLTAPDELCLVPDAEIWAVEEVAMLGLLSGPQVLYLGIPLVLELEPALLRAVICHELGHRRSGHLRFGALAYRASDAMDGVLRGVRQPMDSTGRTVKLLTRPLAVLAFFYRRVTLKARRAHEFEADSTAARVAGSATTAEALRTVYALEHLWRHYRNQTLKAGLPATRPDDPFAAFAALLAGETLQAELRAYTTGPLPSVTRKHDSHPSLAARVARIEQLDAPGTLTTPVDPDGYRNQVRTHADEPLSYLMSALGARPDTGVEPWPRWLARIGEQRS